LTSQTPGVESCGFPTAAAEALKWNWLDVECAPSRAARSTSLKPLSWKSWRRAAAGALTSGRKPSGAGVVEFLTADEGFDLRAAGAGDDGVVAREDWAG
jgi:hypothetical protein